MKGLALFAGVAEGDMLYSALYAGSCGGLSFEVS